MKCLEILICPESFSTAVLFAHQIIFYKNSFYEMVQIYGANFFCDLKLHKIGRNIFIPKFYFRIPWKIFLFDCELHLKKVYRRRHFDIVRKAL